MCVCVCVRVRVCFSKCACVCEKSYSVFAASPTEKVEWMAHIQKCINDLLAPSPSCVQLC